MKRSWLQRLGDEVLDGLGFFAMCALAVVFVIALVLIEIFGGCS